MRTAVVAAAVADVDYYVGLVVVAVDYFAAGVDAEAVADAITVVAGVVVGARPQRPLSDVGVVVVDDGLAGGAVAAVDVYQLDRPIDVQGVVPVT